MQHRYTKNQTRVKLGNTIPLTGGTSTRHQITLKRMHATSKPQKRTVHQHSRLSTQTNYQPNHYTCRQSHTCNTTGHKRNQETGRYQKVAGSTRAPTTCQRCKRLPTKHRSSQHSTSSKGEICATGNRKLTTIRQL